MTPLEQAARQGERVILRCSRSDKPDETAPIERLGRKYAYVIIYSREVAFDLETGYEKSDFPFYRILTRDQDEEEGRRSAVRRRLGPWHLGSRDISKVSTDKLERIAAILEEDPDV